MSTSCLQQHSASDFKEVRNTATAHSNQQLRLDKNVRPAWVAYIRTDTSLNIF